MDVFPVFFRMDGAVVAVFGGGDDAARKVRLLAKTPADIVVFASVLSDAFRAEFSGRVRHVPFEHAADHLPNCRFAIIAELDHALALKAFSLARQAGVPVNRVDHRAWCDFTIPSILDRGRIVAAVASGGAAPVLARDLRGQLETAIPPGIGTLADLAAGLRTAVRIAIDCQTERRRFWEGFFHGPIAEKLLAGDKDGALAAVEAAFVARPASSEHGPVSLVSPPDGPADMITLRAFRAMQTAEWVAHGADVDPGLLDLVRRDAVRTASPADGDALIKAAKAGNRCVVLLPAAEQIPVQQALDAAGITWIALS